LCLTVTIAYAIVDGDLLISHRIVSHRLCAGRWVVGAADRSESVVRWVMYTVSARCTIVRISRPQPQPNLRRQRLPRFCLRGQLLTR
jgi:hypothetical protein